MYIFMLKYMFWKIHIYIYIYIYRSLSIHVWYIHLLQCLPAVIVGWCLWQRCLYIHTIYRIFTALSFSWRMCKFCHMDVNEASISSSTLGLDLSGEASNHPKLLPSQDVETKMVDSRHVPCVFLFFCPEKKQTFFFSEHIHDSPWISAKVRAPKALKLGLRREMLGR